MNSLFRKMNSYLFVFIAFGLALAIALLPYYVNGHIVLGGEGNYVVDFKVLLYNYKYAWQNVMAGFHSPSLNFIYFNGFFFSFLQEFIHNIRVINFVVIFIIYFLPFASMLLVCRELKVTPFLSFLISYFYIVNPFSMCFFYSLNQWNSLALFIIPFLSWIIIRFYRDNIQLFLVFGLASSFFAFTNANPPLMVIYQLAIILMVIFISMYQDTHFSWFQVIKKYLVILGSFILFNLWWMLNWINIMEYIPKTYTKEYALNWAIDVSSRPALFWRSFTFTGLVPVDPLENFLSALYSSAPGLFVSIIPVLIILYFWLRQQFLNTIYCLFISILVITIFLMKGTATPFGFIYKLMMLYVPFFNMFKTPVEKWGVLYTFFFTLLLIFVFKDSKEMKGYKLLLGSFLIYLVFASTPLLTGQLISNYKMHDGNISSRRYIDKPEYNDLREKLNNDQREYRVFSLPGSLNYQVALLTDKDRFYTGMDPLLSNINKQVITADHRLMGYFESDILYDNISLKTFSRLLSIYNVGAIVINKDTHPWFAFQEKENMAELEHIFNNDKRYQKDNAISGAISFYKVKKEYFLPRIYSAANITLIEDGHNPGIPLMYASYSDPVPAIVRKDDAHTIKIFEESNYLFYTDREKIINQLKDKDELEKFKLNRENPFEVGKHSFYISKEGNYTIKAFIKPKRDFLESDFIISSSSGSKASLQTVSGWNIKALNTIYRQSVSDDGMHIDAYFQGSVDVKEGIILTKKFSDIHIKERPYLAFSWEMEDLGVQEVEIDIKITNLNKKITLKANNKQFIINLYEKAKDIFGNEAIDNLFIDEVVLKFKKRDGVDVSDEKKRQTYSFVFKNIAFLKTQPILAEFEDKLVAYLPDTYYYFDGNGELKNVDFLEQVPLDIKDAYKLYIQRFIDLREIPILSLNFPKPEIVVSIDGERTNFPNEWKVLLELDFDGDEKENDRIEIFVPAAGLSDGKLLLSIKAYEEVKKQFPDKKNYNLLSVGISHPDDKVVLYQAVMNKKLIRYREHIYKPSDFRVGDNIFEVNDRVYKLPSIRKDKGQKDSDDNNNWIESNNVFLKAGNHNLSVSENDKFKVEMVEIKPVTSKQINSQRSPKIEFRKINPTRYVVDVKGAKGPFTVVFSESFHEGWKAYIRPLTVNVEPWSTLLSAWKDRRNRREITDHFVVNGYANGWIVPVEKGLGVKGHGSDNEQDFQIVIEYKLQRLFEIGLLISATTLIGCIGYLGYDIVRRRRKTDI